MGSRLRLRGNDRAALMPHAIRIATAGWTIPGTHARHFSGEGSHLARYATLLSAAEINTTFYRSHRPDTLRRWADTVPKNFRFAVKVPREITHDRRLVDAIAPLEKFLDLVKPLGPCLGPLLVQLPPSFAYDAALAQTFFASLRERHAGDVVCEPRHPTWFAAEVGALLDDFRIARVAADPPPVPDAATPGGWHGLAYFRLHGAPKMYFSPYSDADLHALAARLTAAAEHAPIWCVFDNTAHGHALGNALTVQELVAP